MAECCPTSVSILRSQAMGGYARLQASCCGSCEAPVTRSFSPSHRSGGRRRSILLSSPITEATRMGRALVAALVLAALRVDHSREAVRLGRVGRIGESLLRFHGRVVELALLEELMDTFPPARFLHAAQHTPFRKTAP